MSKEFIIIPGAYYGDKYISGKEIAEMWGVDLDSCTVVTGVGSFKKVVEQRRGERVLVAQEDCTPPGWDKYFTYTAGAWGPSSVIANIRARYNVPDDITMPNAHTAAAATHNLHLGMIALSESTSKSIPWCEHQKAIVWLRENGYNG